MNSGILLIGVSLSGASGLSHELGGVTCLRLNALKSHQYYFTSNISFNYIIKDLEVVSDL